MDGSLHNLIDMQSALTDHNKQQQQPTKELMTPFMETNNYLYMDVFVSFLSPRNKDE